MSRGGRYLPESSSGFDIHRDSITRRCGRTPNACGREPACVLWGLLTHESSRVWLPLSWLRRAALAAYQRAQAGSDAAVTNAEARRRAGQRARQQQHGTRRRPAGQTSRYGGGGGGVGRGQRYPSNGRAARQRSERYRAAAAGGRGGVGAGGRVSARRRGLADDDWGLQPPHEDEELMMAASYGRGYLSEHHSHHGHHGHRREEEVSRPFPSWNRSILTEIYLCHARSLSRN
eukprot:COSAG01_NODE_1305_length_10807_cov_3.074897_4_plen_232_part_00